MTENNTAAPEMQIREGIEKVTAEWTATVPTIHRDGGCRADYHAEFDRKPVKFAEGVLAGREAGTFKLCTRCLVKPVEPLVIEIEDDKDLPAGMPLADALAASVEDAKTKRAAKK